MQTNTVQNLLSESHPVPTSIIYQNIVKKR